VARYRDPTGPFIMTQVPKIGPIIMTLITQKWGNIVTPDTLTCAPIFNSFSRML